MSSVTEIVNVALIKVGGKRITDISDLNSDEAILASAIYDKTRQALLRSHTWGFALTKATLAALGDAPVFGYTYAFALPEDFIRIKKVYCPSSKWERVGNAIHTDDSEVNLEYIANTIDPTLFDPLFEELLVLKLAYELAYSISSDKSLKVELKQEYELKLREARAVSSQEKHPRNIKDTSWIDSRLI